MMTSMSKSDQAYIKCDQVVRNHKTCFDTNHCTRTHIVSVKRYNLNTAQSHEVYLQWCSSFILSLMKCPGVTIASAMNRNVKRNKKKSSTFYFDSNH